MKKFSRIAYIASVIFTLLPIVAFAEEILNVEVNKGQLLKLSRPAASVVVADPTTADVQVVSPKTVFVYGKKIGETSLTAIDAGDETIFDGVVSVSHNLSSLKRQVKKISPDANVEFKTVNGGLVIDGSAPSVKDAENIQSLASAFIGANDKVINMLSTNGGDQVMLRVKIVEMARNDLKNFGINFKSNISGGGIVSEIVNGTLDPTTTISRGSVADTNILTKITHGANSLSTLIDILETQGLATVLAEPSLTTVTGKPANFLAGGQYPIPVAGEGGTISIQYQPFGVSLNFTPVVISKERMSILVNPEVSTLNFSNPIQVSGFVYPILDTRKAQATVELGSGQSFVLAGLLRNDTSNNITKLPGVGDLPVLGALFRSEKFQNNQTELVIIVTPYLVHPVSDPKKLQTPLDGFIPSSDMERVMLGSLYKQQDMKEEKEESKEESKEEKTDSSEKSESTEAVELRQEPEEKTTAEATEEKPKPEAAKAKPKSKKSKTDDITKKLNGKSGFILEQ